MSAASLSAGLFSLGRVVGTPAAITALAEVGVAPLSLVARHVQGDWGAISPNDAEQNRTAIVRGSRILSAYPIGPDPWPAKIYVITEPERRHTTVLLADEY